MEEKVRSKRNESLLIVEDDESQLRTLTAIMEEEGFEVIGCSTATEAIEHIKHLDIGVVILDLRLPDLSGTQLLDRLAGATDKIRVIINTAYSSYESAKEALNFGAFAYVEKAGDPDELLRYVHRAFQASLRSYADELETAVAERTHDLLQANELLNKKIKEQEKTENLRRQERDKAQKYLDTAAVMLVAIDSEERIGLINRKGCEILGYKEEEIIGKNWFDNFLPERIRGQVKTVFEKVMREEVDSSEYYENLILTKSGDERLIAWHNTVLKDEKGSVIATLSSGEDITERKKAEEMLRGNEEKLRSIIEHSVEVFYVHDTEHKLTYISPQSKEVFGYAPGEMKVKWTALTTDNSINEKGSEPTERALRTGKKQEPYLLEIRRKDGESRIIEVDESPVKDEKGKVVAVSGALRDVTDRVRAQEAYRSLVDLSLQGLAIFQGDSIVFTNQAMSHITGYSEEEMLAMTPQEIQAFVHPEDRAMVWARHRDRLDGKPVPERYEFRGIRKDGSRCWLDLHARRLEYQGKPAIQAAYVDVTEEKRASEVLRENHDYLQKLTNSMWDAVFSVKMPERVIEWANDSFRLIGYEPQECIGKTTGFLYPDDIEFLDFGNKLKGAIAAGKDVLHAEQILKRKNGDTFPAEITTTFFKEIGEIVRITNIIRDVSDRKNTEKEIQNLAKFPSENPNVVLRISKQGSILYANRAGEILLSCKKCFDNDKTVSKEWLELITEALSSKSEKEFEFECENRVYSFIIAPVAEGGYANFYGSDITKRKNAEERLLEHREKLKAMASEILRTEERERQRIAVGLHDDICQKLVLIKLTLESSLLLVSNSNVLASLKVACEAIAETIGQAESLTFALSNPVLRELGLVTALKKHLAEELQERRGIAFELEGDEKLSIASEEIKSCLFRVSRELLMNVVKHAHARKVKVSAGKSPSRIWIRIQDDGVGFEDAEASSGVSRTSRFGLFSIREQLEYIGGHLKIESERGRGATVTVVVPLGEKPTVQRGCQ